jgi:hypothetical protein
LRGHGCEKRLIKPSRRALGGTKVSSRVACGEMERNRLKVVLLLNFLMAGA